MMSSRIIPKGARVYIGLLECGYLERQHRDRTLVKFEFYPNLGVGPPHFVLDLNGL